jgi:hypothetical protein
VQARLLLLTSLAALLLHVFVGWEWSPLAAIVGGYLQRSHGAAIGSLSVGLVWSGLVFFNLLAAPAQVLEMASVVGALMGNFPDWTVFLVSILIGFVLGAIGGLLGQSLSALNLLKK